jgi:hypothetical protein
MLTANDTVNVKSRLIPEGHRTVPKIPCQVPNVVAVIVNVATVSVFDGNNDANDPSNHSDPTNISLGFPCKWRYQRD